MVSSVASSPELGDTLDRILSAYSLTLPRTLMLTGELNVLIRSCASPPLTTIFSLNVTGVSNVVTRLSIASASSAESTRAADSRNSSSPVIASILRLPMYRSPLEFRPV